MYTQSFVSDSSDVTASSILPSKLASNPELFFDWMGRAKVMVAPSQTAPQYVLSQFDDLYQLGAMPDALQGTLPNPIYKTEAEFQRTVQEWATTVQNTEEDEYHIIGQMRTLALAHYRIRGTSANYTKENSQRRGVNDILEIAFSSTIGCRCKFTTDDRYRLVRLGGNSNAQSDTLITIPFPDISLKLLRLRLTFTDQALIHQLYWSANGAQEDFSIIGLAVESKTDDAAHNRNQLIMVLTTAQSQRKALSLENSIIMGATACRGRVQIYSSCWDSENDTIIQIYEHEQQFDLTNPIEVIHLYVFCVKLERSLQENFIPQLQQFVAPTEMKIKGVMWRSSDQIRKHRRKGTASNCIGDARSGNSGGNGGGDTRRGRRSGSNNDDIAVKSNIRDNHNANDWPMQLTAWKKEAVEGAKEASLISGEGESLTKHRLRQVTSRNIASSCVL